MPSEALQIQEKTFLINRLIQQAPRQTLIREFFKNCEESAAKAPSGHRIVRIYPVDIEGVRKLAFWNTGPGMTDEQLKQATDLSSSIGKEMGLDQNYGIGAKVSGLTVSPEGIRYRSCRNGTVTQLVIGYDDELETYARFSFDIPGQPSATTIDVTDICKSEGYDVEFDWTEVVLYGEDAEHDTVAEPLGRGRRVDRSYIPTDIFRRFSSFAEGLEVRVDVSMTKGGGKDETGRTRQLKTLSDILDKVGQSERITHEASGVSVHFIHDPKAETSSHTLSSRANAAAASTTFCALVHKGERYDFKTKKGWSSAAPNFGIPFGSKVLTVEIELADDMALPNQYRNGLTLPEDRSDLLADDFTDIVRECIPDWVREIIKDESPESNDNLNDLQSALQKLLDEYRVPTKILDRSDKPVASATASNGSEDSSENSDVPGADDKAHDGSANEGEGHNENRARRANRKKIRLAPEGAKPSASSLALERVPDIEVIYDPEEILDKEMKGRAGRYYKANQNIFVNGTYPIIERMGAELERELASEGDRELVMQHAKDAAARFMAFRVGKAVCYAIAKRLSDDWTEDDLDKATTPESLSMAADDYRQSYKEARKWAREMIRAASLETPEAQEHEPA